MVFRCGVGGAGASRTIEKIEIATIFMVLGSGTGRAGASRNIENYANTNDSYSLALWGGGRRCL